MQMVSVSINDLEALVALRVKAMQPSLEAVGRFDPARARERFVKNFNPKNTVKVTDNDLLLGFYVIVNKADHLWVDHLYIDPQYQGAGIGAKIINNIKEYAIEQKLALRLAALKESRANDFYLKQGFIQIEEQSWDNIYEWSA